MTEKRLRVGLVIESAGTDNPYNHGAYLGLERAVRELGIRGRVLTPTPKDGAKPGQSVTHAVTLTNPAYNDDSYTISTSSTKGWTATVLQADCTTPAPVAGTPVASGGMLAAGMGIADGGTARYHSPPSTSSCGNSSMNAVSPAPCCLSRGGGA